MTSAREVEEDKFQPTRPLRGATQPACRSARSGQNFNPRAPCGARPIEKADDMIQYEFQPTRPLRGATAFRGKTDREVWISTHAPLAGRDPRLK